MESFPFFSLIFSHIRVFHINLYVPIFLLNCTLFSLQRKRSHELAPHSTRSYTVEAFPGASTVICSHFHSTTPSGYNSPIDFWHSALICWQVKQLQDKLCNIIFNIWPLALTLQVFVHIGTSWMHYKSWAMKLIKHISTSWWNIRLTAQVLSPLYINTLVLDFLSIRNFSTNFLSLFIILFGFFNLLK